MRDKPTHLPTAKRGGHFRDMKNLFDIISEINGTQFANIVYSAECGFPKKANLGEVSKVVTLNVQLNYDYASEVRKRIAAKGGNPNTFTTESLPWGQWEIQNKVIAHKGERYLRYYCVEGEYPEVQYFVNGVAATPQEIANIKAYLASKEDKTSVKQTACGLNKSEQVVPRSVKFSNIISLAIEGGETYTKQSSAAA